MCIEPGYEVTFINLCLVKWATRQINVRKEQNSTKDHRGRKVQVFSILSSRPRRWPATCGIKQISMPLTLKRQTT